MKKAKRLISIILSVLMVVCMMPMGMFSAFAAEHVHEDADKNNICDDSSCGVELFVDRSWDENTKRVKETLTTIPSAKQMSFLTVTLNAGEWYYVSGSVTSIGTVKVNGTSENPTHIILKDGAVLNANKGIVVADGNALCIYGQSKDSGKIVAVGDEFAAGIGSGRNGNGGNIAIYGGTVTASGVTGIGGGSSSSGNGTLTVNGKVSIKAGASEAEAQETTVEAYTTSRDAYVSIVPIPHVHEFAETWSTSETAHWYACTADDCDIEDYASCGIEDAAYAAHTWSDGKCSVCGYECKHNFENYICTVCGAEDTAAKALADAKTAAIAAIDAATTEYNADYAEAAKFMINTCETVESVNGQKELVLAEMAYIDAEARAFADAKTAAIAEIDEFIKDYVPSATQKLNQFKDTVSDLKDSINTATDKDSVDETLANGLKALNEFVPEKYTVNVANGATVAQTLNVTKSPKYYIATVKIAEGDGIKDGKWFVYWEDDNGNIVSTYSTYSFYVVRNVTLTPVYVSPDEYWDIRNSVVACTNVVRADDNHDGTVTLFAEHSASKKAFGEQIVQHGIVYTTDASQADNLTLENAKAKKATAATTKTALSGLLRTTVEVEENETLYAKSYVTYADGETVYSDKMVTVDPITTADFESEIISCTVESELVQAEEIIPAAEEITEPEAPTFMSILNAIIAMFKSIIAIF